MLCVLWTFSIHLPMLGEMKETLCLAYVWDDIIWLPICPRKSEKFARIGVISESVILRNTNLD